MVQLQRMEEENAGGGVLMEEEEEELECKICYCPYSPAGRRPKLLHCCHRLCCRCLAELLALGEPPATAVVCPFCRYVTSLPPSALPLPLPASLPDDHGLLALLSGNRRLQRNQNPRDGSTELLLTPSTLGSLLGAGASSFSFPPAVPSSYASIRGSPNFVVITIVEPPPPPSLPRSAGRPPSELRPHRPLYRSSSSLDSAASASARGSARALLWLLGLLYVCSLPLGVYLLAMQKTALGGLLVSLVPASITAVIAYGFCRCVCQELWDCIPP